MGCSGYGRMGPSVHGSVPGRGPNDSAEQAAGMADAAGMGLMAAGSASAEGIEGTVGQLADGSAGMGSGMGGTGEERGTSHGGWCDPTGRRTIRHQDPG